ncbi:MAG: glycoside hydrolase family 16 protein, partial [Actinomycetota bacterium]|nr:glycoside hydrolase family 16 protein [Actinomycetota bacterium]
MTESSESTTRRLTLAAVATLLLLAGPAQAAPPVTMDADSSVRAGKRASVALNLDRTVESCRLIFRRGGRTVRTTGYTSVNVSRLEWSWTVPSRARSLRWEVLAVCKTTGRTSKVRQSVRVRGSSRGSTTLAGKTIFVSPSGSQVRFSSGAVTFLTTTRTSKAGEYAAAVLEFEPTVTSCQLHLRRDGRTVRTSDVKAVSTSRLKWAWSVPARARSLRWELHAVCHTTEGQRTAKRTLEVKGRGGGSATPAGERIRVATSGESLRGPSSATVPPDAGNSSSAPGAVNMQNPTTLPAGKTLVFEDNFDGPAVDTSLWGQYYSPGHAGNGLRRPSAFSQHNGQLVVTASWDGANITSGGMAHRTAYTYGSFEVRVRTEPDPTGQTSGVVLTWPRSGNWPHDGELDWYETGTSPNRTPFSSFLHHYGATWGGDQTHIRHDANASDWHVLRMDWGPDAIKIYRDGVFAGALTDASKIPDVAHNIAIQLDAFGNRALPRPV